MKGNRKNESNNNDTLPPTSYPSAEDETTFPVPPPRIEGYKILGELGKAGQGRVWRALQLSTQREVALKVPRAGLLHSERSRARFEREVEVASRLKHPNIARIYDSGIHQDRYYYTMELIDGLQLNEYVEQHNLTQRQILELMRTVCQAVQHAHQNAVIHRDIKPSNILVTEDGQPHIVDFGLAKYIPGEDISKAISIDGEMVGTPAYMSPEQALGEMEKVDTRTDVYSLGAILYALLTGENPHDLSGSRSKVLQRIAQGKIRRPRKINPKMDKELEALLLKSLDNDPDRRYHSAGELAKDIDNYLKHEPLSAKGPTTIYFLRKRISKCSWQSKLLMVIAVISVPLLITYTISKIRDAIIEGIIARNPRLDLTFVLYPSDPKDNMYSKFSPIRNYLEKEATRLLWRPVYIRLDIRDTYQEAIDTILNGEADFGRTGPAPYITAKENDPNIKLLVMEQKKGSKRFKGMFIVRKDSNIWSVSDLKKSSKKIKFAFGDEMSTIGRHLAQAELVRAGIYSDDLASYEYLGSHYKVAEAVLQGDFDVGAVKESTFHNYEKEGKGLRCIHDFPNVTKPWFVKKNFKKDFSHKVFDVFQQILLGLKDPKVLNELEVSGFTEALDSDYNPVRERMKEAAMFINKKKK